jgi:dipeptidyl-peptidase-4
MNAAKDGKQLQAIQDNAVPDSKIKALYLPTKFFCSCKQERKRIECLVIKPKILTFKKYPVFMFQYSGPGSQQVMNAWSSSNDYWFMMLTQQGYIVACVDGRGTGFKGADFKSTS